MQDCGIIRTYYDNGNIEEEYFQMNGLKHGLFTLYEHYGDIKIRTIEYVEGKKHGTYKEYHRRSNDVFYICQYNDNIKVGQAIFYHENGGIDNICSYENGKISGMRYWYYENGNLLQSCNYVDGMRQGECTIYKPDGTIKYISLYVDNEVIYE